MAETVLIRAAVPPSGLVLNLHREVNELGIRSFVPTGDAVTLRPGDNHIDASFWAQWSKQNEGSALLNELKEVKDAARNPEPSETAAAPSGQPSGAPNESPEPIYHEPIPPRAGDD